MSESKLQGSANSEGVTPLMVSLKEGNTDIVQLLLRGNSTESKAVRSLLEEKDNDERSVFHYAFESRKPADVTQILVEVTSKAGWQKLCRGHGGPPPKSLDLDKNFKPEPTLFCRKLRFVAIYALFRDLWPKKVPF